MTAGLLKTDDVDSISADGCWICGRMPDEKRRLSVDHHHGLGFIRGVLCTNCNLGLGNFQDRVDLLEAAIDYLKNAELRVMGSTCMSCLDLDDWTKYLPVTTIRDAGQVESWFHCQRHHIWKIQHDLDEWLILHDIEPSDPARR